MGKNLDEAAVLAGWKHFDPWSWMTLVPDFLVVPAICASAALAAAVAALLGAAGSRYARAGKPWTWWERLLVAVGLVLAGYSFHPWLAAGSVLAGLDPAHLDLLEIWASLPVFQSDYDGVPLEQALETAGPVRAVLAHLAERGELHLLPEDLVRALTDQVLHCRTASIFHFVPVGDDVDEIATLLMRFLGDQRL
jgi:hypothetical protein